MKKALEEGDPPQNFLRGATFIISFYNLVGNVGRHFRHAVLVNRDHITGL